MTYDAYRTHSSQSQRPVVEGYKDDTLNLLAFRGLNGKLDINLAYQKGVSSIKDKQRDAVTCLI